MRENSVAQPLCVFLVLCFIAHLTILLRRRRGSQDAWAAAERARAGEVAAIEAGVQELRDAHAAQCARLRHAIT